MSQDANSLKGLGWFASTMAILMFAAYFDQIRLNLSGQPGSVILPIATFVNCTAWSLYAHLKHPKDWPIFSCNVFGACVGLATAVTAALN